MPLGKKQGFKLAPGDHRGGDGSQGTAVRARRVPRQVSQGREGECRRQRIELGRIRVIGPCEPQETGVDFAGREGSVLLLDCFIPSQGLQGFWTGRLEELEDCGPWLERVLPGGTSVLGWKGGRFNIPLSLRAPA